MKILLNILSLTTILFAWISQSYAQELNPRYHHLTEISEKIKEYYIHEDIANKLSTQLEIAKERGFFDNLSNQEFADSLSSFLVRTSEDRHFNVLFRPNSGQKAPDEKELLKAADEINRRWNYGFEKVNRLSGNIGYIEYTGFPEGNRNAQHILDATMNFVTHTNALILDLRDNRGGDGKMVQLFLSYFFEDKIELSDSYTRYNDKTTKSYTKGKVKGQKYLDKPIYILVNNQTISAAEALAYDLQARNKATVIGEATYGAANPIKVFFIENLYALFIPITENHHSITHSNWEHTGVPIDIPVRSENALTKAHIIALEQLIRSNTKVELSQEEMYAKIEKLRSSLYQD